MVVCISSHTLTISQMRTWRTHIPIYFCGEVFCRHDLPLDRSSMIRWRQRLGEEKALALLQANLHRVSDRAPEDGAPHGTQLSGPFAGRCRKHLPATGHNFRPLINWVITILFCLSGLDLGQPRHVHQPQGIWLTIDNTRTQSTIQLPLQ